ncbi:hypothetical protein BCR32DRAFT_296476 [Anaeromyces robustus]|uniref:DH domain-containing protein n=1 Tax=Anaeromyces robustus TaxID=1754192 RepID=A0A1Y1WS44_9FUNG|nr:hypothetical protein BCR32DRAFT_296476 [Anaeromyces robustus]|eukprot:ORX76088.1 hypothetical protein BCR32DRAFT_296476 [Anaeromyces robustus]
MSKNNTIKQNQNPLKININDTESKKDHYHISSTTSESSSHFSYIINDVTSNKKIHRSREDSNATTKSDTGSYNRGRTNSNRSDKNYNVYSNNSRNSSKDVLYSARSDITPSSNNRSRNNSSSYSNVPSSSSNKQQQQQQQNIMNETNSRTRRNNSENDTNSRSRRNNSENETLHKVGGGIVLGGLYEENDTKLGRNNSSKSETLHRKGQITNNNSNNNINGKSNKEKKIFIDTLNIKDIAMDITSPFYKNNNGNGSIDNNKAIVNPIVHRSKSNINISKSAISSPINQQKSSRSRSGSNNSSSSTSNKYKFFDEEYKKFINTNRNNSGSSGNSNIKDNRSGKIDINNNLEKLLDKSKYDISNTKTLITEKDNNFSSSTVEERIKSANTPTKSSFNTIQNDSPRNIINITPNERFLNYTEKSINSKSPNNDITFPLPPSSQSKANISGYNKKYDNIHKKTSSYSPSSYSPGDQYNNYPNDNVMNMKINTIKASTIKDNDSSSCSSSGSINKFNGGLPNNKSYNNGLSYIANFDNNLMKKTPEPISMNISNDINSNLNYNDEQFRTLNYPSNAPNNIMKMKKKQLFQRNTIISTGEYMYDKKSPSGSRFEKEKDLQLKKTGSEPIFYNNINMKSDYYNNEMEITKSKPNIINYNKDLPETPNKVPITTIINNGILEDNSGTGKLFHPVRSHSLHANKMFSENGHGSKLLNKKSNTSINEMNIKCSSPLSTINPIRNNFLPSTNYSSDDKAKQYNDSVMRSNTISIMAYKDSKSIPSTQTERTNTINSKMYLKSNNNGNNKAESNKKIYEKIYNNMRNNANLTPPDIDMKKLNLNFINTNIFDMNDKDLFQLIDDSNISLTENPLLSSNPITIMCPNLIDAISTSIPIDAWDFSDDEDDEPPTPLFLGMDEDFDPMEGLQTEPRGYVVANLFETEKNYLADLYTLNNFFKEKLKTIISPVALISIFEGVDDLFELHKRFYKSLYKVVRNWNKNSLIGKLFIEYRHEWQIYQNFIDNYARSLEAIRREEETNPQFRQFMKDCLASTETNRKSLKEYLMFPVQRTTRYSLIIKDLIKYIDKDHPDYNDLNLALKEMTLLATKVNDVKRREEETTSMFTAFEQTENCPPTIITHKRRLIYQIDVLDILKNRRPMHIFLFSDLFMLTKTNKNATTATALISHPLARVLRSHSKQIYRYVRCIDYRDIIIEEDEQYQRKNIVRLILNYKKDRYTNNNFNMNNDPLTSIGSSGSINTLPLSSGTTFPSNTIPDSEYTLYCFQFVQYDAEKQYSKFILALKTLKEGKGADWIVDD